jgi:hypothetical protein
MIQGRFATRSNYSLQFSESLKVDQEPTLGLLVPARVFYFWLFGKTSESPENLGAIRGINFRGRGHGFSRVHAFPDRL